MRKTMGSRRHGVLALTLCGWSIAASGLLLAAEVVETWDVPDAKWRSGPVKYLLTKEEDQAYKKLKTDEERKTFVDSFWLERDPTPGTPDNEYRAEFYRRAKEAAALYTDDEGKGWQDDRGRVYIQLGKPDETQEGTRPGGASSLSSGSGLPDSLGAATGSTSERPESPIKTVKFIYLQDPLTGKRARAELDFQREPGGGYKLQQRLDWTQPALRGIGAHHVAAKPAAAPPAAAAGTTTGGSPAPGAAPSGAPAAVTATPAPGQVPAPAGVPAAAVEATPQSELMALVRGAEAPAATIPLDLAASYYKAADKSTFATLTVMLKRAGLPAGVDPSQLILSAELLDPSTGESRQRFFRQEQFGAWDGNGNGGELLLYQADRPLEPGAYKAVFAVKDPASGSIGKLEKDLDVPSYKEEGLRLSTVTLAGRLDSLPAPPEKRQPFVMGSKKVIPRRDNVYKDGDELTFYYQIYGAATDPGTQYPKVDLSYAFEKQSQGQWRMVGGKPVVSTGQVALAQAFGLPIQRWPAGDYRISIKVTDTIAGTTATAEIPFVVSGPPPAAGAKPAAKQPAKNPG